MHATTLGQECRGLSAGLMGRARTGVEAARRHVRTIVVEGCGGDQDPYWTMIDGRRGSMEGRGSHGTAAGGAVLQALDSARELHPLPMRILCREVTLPGKDDAEDARQMALRGLRLGDAVLITLGAEAFVEYAFYGKSISKAEETLVLGYTDSGGVGYLCTARAFEEGGYEPRTTRVAPESEQIVKDAMAEMLAELSA